MSVAYIPSPTISYFKLGPVTIRFYAIFILIGIICAMYIITRKWKRMGGNFDQILDIALVSVPSGIIGARLYHVITTPEKFFGPSGDWVEMFRIWNGGLGIWGGVVLGSLAAWGVCRYRHYPTALLADAAAPALLIAQGIGRLGNWFNQELYGAPTTLPWGLKLNNVGGAIGHSESCYDGLSCPEGTLFHPTFLYEMIWNFIGAALIIFCAKKVMQKCKAGSLFIIYVMWYTAGRMWIESLRIDFSHVFLGVRINVWVSIGVFICAAIIFALLQRHSLFTDKLSEKLIDVTADENEKNSAKSDLKR